MRITGGLICLVEAYPSHLCSWTKTRIDSIMKIGGWLRAVNPPKVQRCPKSGYNRQLRPEGNAWPYREKRVPQNPRRQSRRNCRARDARMPRDEYPNRRGVFRG